MKYPGLCLISPKRLATCSWLCLFSTFAQAGPTTDQRVELLLSQMSLDEKIGQMVQVDMDALKDNSDIQKYCLGSMLSGGNSDPADNRPGTWLNAVNEYQAWALKTRLKIPLIYGIDAVHGHNNIDGAVIFPHNIGLGATHNPGLVEQAERITAMEVAGTGIRWAFAPLHRRGAGRALGRTYESFGDSPELVSELGQRQCEGFRGRNYRIPALSLHVRNTMWETAAH